MSPTGSSDRAVDPWPEGWVRRRLGPADTQRVTTRVRVVDRASGVIARSEWFEDEAAARRRHSGLSADAAAMDAAALRARYRLP
jgi:hypothetical protein